MALNDRKPLQGHLTKSIHSDTAKDLLCAADDLPELLKSSENTVETDTFLAARN